MIKNKNIAFLGAGFMGESLIRGLVQSKTVSPKRITVFDPNGKALSSVVDRLKIKAAKSNRDAVAEADIIMIAVKPQIVPDVLKELGRKINKSKLVISIAAGVTISSLKTMLPAGARIVRSMPNMAAMVGEGATAICPGGAAGDDDITLARQIFDAVGETVVIDESLMDAVTGLSGSGPAFVFMFLEALIDAGVRCGLSREVSTELAGQTLYGAAKLARMTNEHPAILKDRITSPGGTTIAGIASLENDRFRSAVVKAIEAATKRSKELGNQ